MKINRYIIASGLLALQLCAADGTWVGSTADWNAMSNWTPITTGGPTGIATFQTSGVTSFSPSTSNVAPSLSGLLFTSTTTSYAISGTNSITLTSSIINSGTVSASIATGLAFGPNANAITITPGSGGLTFSGGMAGGTISLGTGTLTLNTAPSTVNSLSGTGTIANAALLTINGSATSTFNGNISGAGGLTIGSLNSLTLGGTNSYGGTTTINGTLTAGSTSAFSSSSAFSMTGGHLQLATYNNTIASLAGDSSSFLNLGSATLSLGSGTYSGRLEANGTWGITKTGGGTFTLSGDVSGPMNSIAGTITVTGGTFTAGSAGALPTSSTISVGTAGTFANSAANTITTLNGSGAASTTLSAALTVTGTSTYVGTITTINSSALTLPSGTFNFTGGASSTVPITMTGSSTLNITGNTTIGGLTGATASGSSPTVALTGAVGITDLTINVPALQTNSYYGTMTSSGGWLYIGGTTGVFELTAPGLNSVTNFIIANLGTLKLGVSGAISSSAEFAGGGILDINGTTTTIAVTNMSGQILLGAGGGSLTISGSAGSNFSGVISGTGSVILNAHVDVSGLNTYIGPTTIQNSADLQSYFANSFSPNSIHSIEAGGTLDLQTYPNQIANLSGSGTVSLDATVLSLGPTYTTALTNESFSGTFQVTTSGGLTVNFANSASSFTVGANVFPVSPLALLDLTVTSGIFAMTGSNTVNTLNGTGGEVQLTGSGVNLNIAGPACIYTGKITGTGSLALSGTSLTLNNTLPNLSTYSGPTTITGAAILYGGNSNTFSTNSVITFTDSVFGGVLNLNGFDNTVANLSSSAATAGGVALTNKTLTLSGLLTGASQSFAGAISDSGLGNLTINAPCTLILTGTSSGSTYNGITTIRGVLSAGDVNVFSANSLVNVETGGLLSLNGNSNNNSIANLTGSGAVNLAGSTLSLGGDNNPQTFSGTLQANADGWGLTKNGTGTFTLSGTTDITNTGTITINSSGTISAGLNTLPNSSILQLNNTSHLVITGANTIQNLNGASGTSLALSDILTIGSTGAAPTGTFYGAITGSGGLTFANSINYTFSSTGINTYAGATTINSGVLSAGAADALSHSSAVILASNTSLQLNHNSATIASLAGNSSSTVNLGAGGGTFTIGTAAASSTTFAGAITGTGSVVITGTSGTLILSGNSTYTGTTTVNGGILQMGTTDALPTTTAVTLAGGTLALNGNPTHIASLTGTSNVTLGALAGLLTIGTSGTSYSGIISGAGGVTLSAGTFTTSGANTYSGTTTIAGNWTTGGTTLSSSSMVQMSVGTLTLTTGPNTIANLNGTGTIVASTNLTFGGDNNAGTFTSSAWSGAGAITKAGTGIFTLSGTSTYTGNTLVTGGTFKAGADNAFSSSSLVTLSPGTTLSVNSWLNTISNLTGSGNVYLGAGVLTLGDANSQTFTGAITGITTSLGGIVKNGIGAFTLGGISGSNTYGGLTTINAGTFQAGVANIFSKYSTVSMTGGTLALQTFANTIGGLSGAAGTVTGSGQLTVGQNNADTSFSGIINSTGGLVKVGTGILTLSGANTYTGGTQINGGAISIALDNGLGGVGALTLNNGTLTTTGAFFSARAVNFAGPGTINIGAALTLSGNMTGSGTFTKSGVSNLTLSGTNSYSGATTISAGQLIAGSTQAFSAASEITISSGATLSLVTFSNTIPNLSGSGTVNLGTATLTLGNSNSTTYSGIISASAGNLVKQGSGSFTLNGVCGYTGTTSVNAGTFVVNTSINSATTVASGATLKGIGTIIGSVTVSGTIAPGNSIGTLTVGSYIANAGSTYNVELSQATSDLIFATGTAVINAGATLNVLPQRGTYDPTHAYQVIYAAGGLTDEFTNVITPSDRTDIITQYTADSLYLYLTIKSAEEIGEGFNARQVAVVIDALSDANQASWVAALDDLFDLSQAELKVALNELCPAQLKGLAIIQQNNAVRMQNGISLRFQNLLDRKHCPLLKGCKVNTNPIYLWIDGFNSKLRQPSNFIDTNPQVGYHTSSGGGSVGLDYNITKQGYVGIMGGGTYTDVKWAGDHGSGHITSGYVGLYGSSIGALTFLNASLLGATNNFIASRKIIYTGVNTTAHSNHNGTQLLTHLDGGLNINCYGFTIRPFESMNYIIQHERPFTETGAGVYDLNIHKTNPQIFRNELGINFARCFNISKNSRILADIKLSWVSENRITGTRFTSSFVDFSQTFLTEGYYPNRSLFSPGATLTGNFADDSAYITVTYDADIGHAYLDQRTGAQLGIRF